jgi:hypothetical protein
MLLKQFARKDTAYNFADSIKTSHTDLYVSYSVYHYQVIASNRIRKPQNVVYYFYQGSLQLDNSLNFPATIYADKAKFRYNPTPSFDGNITLFFPPPSFIYSTLSLITPPPVFFSIPSMSYNKLTILTFTLSFNNLISISIT